MDGWEIDPHRLRDLREQVSIRQIDMARLLECHHRHYVRFETTAPHARGAQPSPELGYAICRVLTEAHGRPITFGDFARTVPSRRAGAA